MMILKKQRRQEIVFLGLKVIRIHNQTGRDDTNDLPFDHSLGEFRIFHLLADRRLEARVDELCQVGGDGVIGKAAERDAVLFALVS